MSDELEYGPGFDMAPLKGYNSYNEVTVKADDNIFLKDIAQSRYFTVTLNQLKDGNGNPITFKAPNGSWRPFLPVKNIGLSFTSYENISVPFSIFSDLQFLQKKKVTTISVTCYDTDDDIIEKAIQAWEQRCFPNNMYVQYLDKIYGEFIYQSYDVKGKPSYSRTLYVIPVGSVGTSRDYDGNNEKLITFSLSVIGCVGASARGTSGGDYSFLDTSARIAN